MEKMEDYQRPNVSSRRYRQLENIEMSLALLLPDDLGEVCIVMDLLANRVRRYISNERMNGHGGSSSGGPLVAEAGEGNLVRLRPVD